MIVDVYKLFRDNNLVDDYKEYNELVRLRCMYINEEVIEEPSKKLKVSKKVKNIRAVNKKVLI